MPLPFVAREYGTSPKAFHWVVYNVTMLYCNLNLPKYADFFFLQSFQVIVCLKTLSGQHQTTGPNRRPRNYQCDSQILYWKLVYVYCVVSFILQMPLKGLCVTNVFSVKLRDCQFSRLYPPYLCIVRESFDMLFVNLKRLLLSLY